MRCEDCLFFFLLEHAKKSKATTSNNPAPAASPIMSGQGDELDGVDLLATAVDVGGDFLEFNGGGGACQLDDLGGGGGGGGGG